MNKIADRTRKIRGRVNFRFKVSELPKMIFGKSEKKRIGGSAPIIIERT